MTAFLKQFLIPVAFMVLVALAALWGGLFWLTALQNRQEARRELELVQTVQAAKLEIVRANARIIAVWDDAVRNLITSPDRQWFHANVGEYAFLQFGYDSAAIIDGDARAIYTSQDGRAVRMDPDQLLGAGYARAIRDHIAVAALDAPDRVGLSMSPRGLVVFGIARVRPSSPATTVAPDQKRYIVLADRVDQAWLADIGDRTRIDPVRLEAPGLVGRSKLALTAYGGKPVAQLAWVPAPVGDYLRKDMVPWLALLSFAVAGVACLVLQRAFAVVDELKANVVRQRYLSNQDMLTKLPNRRALEAHILKHSSGALTMFFMDLDGFKDVNDRLGHAQGDEVLRLTAQRLHRLKPQGALLARLGGDEFAILVQGNAGPAQTAQLAEAALAAIRQPYELPGDCISIGVSIGISQSTDALDEDLMRRADLAMYAAKARGRNNWQRYSPELDQHIADRRNLSSDLRDAIAAGDIGVVYQPIVQARDGDIVCVEALARWDHPRLGPIAPDVFIPLAEESGLIGDLGQHVLRTACLAARDWPCRLAVNLSPAQFWDMKLVGSLIAILEECGFSPAALELEITETYLLRQPDQAAAIIRQLRMYGIRIALDDFGTGYASIAYLRLFDLDLVKLDRSLTARVADDQTAVEVVRAIIALCNALKLPLLAEGVETPAQAEMLRNAGCAYMQGWHFGYPQSAEATAASFRHGKQVRA